MDYITRKFSKLYTYLEQSIIEGGYIPGIGGRSAIVRSEEFEQLESMIKDHEGGVKNPRRSERASMKPVTQDVTDILLEKCKQTIPSMYFRNETPSLSMISRDRQKTEEEQDRLVYFVNQIDICILNQVNLNFSKFVGGLITIDTMDDLIEASVEKLRVVRQNNRLLHEKTVEKSHRLRTLVLRQANLRTLIELAEKVRSYRNAKKAPLQVGHHDLSQKEVSQLVLRLRENKPALLKLKSIKGLDQTIRSLSSGLTDAFSQDFASKLLAHMDNKQHDAKESLSFWSRMTKLARQGESDILNGQLQELQLHSHSSASQNSGQIYSFLLQTAGLSELSVQPSNNQINMLLNSRFGEFLFQLKRFCVGRLSSKMTQANTEPLQTLLSKLSLSFFYEVVVFHSQRAKLFIRRLIQTILHLKEKLANTQVGGLFNRLLQIVQFTVEVSIQNLVRLINLRAIEWTCQIQEFLDLVDVFSQWEAFVGEEMTASLRSVFEEGKFLRQWAEPTKLNLIRPYVNQMSERFLNNLHKNQMQVELIEAFENERWACIDIPTDLYVTLSTFMGNTTSTPYSKGRNAQGSFYADQPVARRDRSGFVRQQDLKQSQHLNRRVKIVKDECTIDGRRFKLTDTFLLLLQIMGDYVQLGKHCPTLKGDVVAKLSDLVRFYNSKSCQLILGAGAVVFGKLGQKSVSSRHLCVCAITLELLIYLIERINETFPLPGRDKLIEGISDHHKQIIQKLKQLLQTRIHSSMPDVDMKTQPTKGTEDIVRSVHTLFDIVDEYLSADTLSHIFDWEIFQRFLVRIRKLNDQHKASRLRPQVIYYFNELNFLVRVIPDLPERRKAVYAHLGIEN